MLVCCFPIKIHLSNFTKKFRILSDKNVHSYFFIMAYLILTNNKIKYKKYLNECANYNSSSFENYIGI